MLWELLILAFFSFRIYKMIVAGKVSTIYKCTSVGSFDRLGFAGGVGSLRIVPTYFV
jgi:hypothetical protein